MRRLRLQKRRSGELACRRLKLLLAADQIGCSPELLEMLKQDVCQVIARYMEIDSEEMEWTVCRGAIPALHADIPIRSFHCKGIV